MKPSDALRTSIRTGFGRLRTGCVRTPPYTPCEFEGVRTPRSGSGNAFALPVLPPDFFVGQRIRHAPLRLRHGFAPRRKPSRLSAAAVPGDIRLRAVQHAEEGGKGLDILCVIGRFMRRINAVWSTQEIVVSVWSA
jgi:hypothetical protein